MPASDRPFSKDLNGTALTEANIQYRRDNGRPHAQWRAALEGIKINDRWAILYSKYDIGCASERHQSMDCRATSRQRLQNRRRRRAVFAAP